jgi:hypothetical protein
MKSAAASIAAVKVRAFIFLKPILLRKFLIDFFLAKLK